VSRKGKYMSRLESDVMYGAAAGSAVREISNALSELLGHNARKVRVWDYFYKLWWATLYSIHCCSGDDNVFNTLFCLWGATVLNVLSEKKLQLADFVPRLFLRSMVSFHTLSTDDSV
jgi:hypothetical protein